MIAICAALSFGALGSAARFFQGNGHAGPGRISVYILCVIGAWIGLTKMSMTPDVTWLALLATGIVAGWNTGGGRTKWENIPYSLARYTLPAAVAMAPWAYLQGEWYYMTYAGIGPIIALNQYFLAEHKPQWIADRVGGRDVATIPAGFFVAMPWPLFYLVN